MEKSGYDGAVDAQLSEVTIYGLRVEPSSVVVNSRSNASFTWEPDDKVNPLPPHIHTYPPTSSHILPHTHTHMLSLLKMQSYLE